MFEELALHSSVVLFPICSLSSCMCMDFSLSPGCGQDEWNKKKQHLSTQIPWHWLRLLGVWVAGRKQHGTSWSKDKAGGEEGAGCFACCLALCDVGLGKKSVTEMKQAQNKDWLGRSLSNQLHTKLSGFGDVLGLSIPTIFYSSLCDLWLCVQLSSLKCSFLV